MLGVIFMVKSELKPVSTYKRPFPFDLTVPLYCNIVSLVGNQMQHSVDHIIQNVQKLVTGARSLGNIML